MLLRSSFHRKKNHRIVFVLFVCMVVLAIFFVKGKPSQKDMPLVSGVISEGQQKTEEQWKKLLTPLQYKVMREGATETPFTGLLLHETRKGTYFSAGCDKPLFRSEQKYDSGTGWPSFWKPISDENIVLKNDLSLPFEPRVEVLDTCGNHLGHVFQDGPEPTGMRYCMNSAALRFVADEN